MNAGDDMARGMGMEPAREAARAHFKLCGVENNERFLAGRPHTVVGDFAATYAFGLEEERASGLVMNGFLEDEGISLERLHADALAAEASRGIALYYMSDIMDNLLAGDEPRNILASGKLPEDMPDSPVEMYVLTNERRHFGASAILQGDALRRVGEILGGDYVVLPSSVHEVIIVPAEEMGVTSQECRAMVREINDTTVRPEERLSDKVQYYDVANERLVGYEEYEREREQTPLKTARDILLDQGDLYGFVPYTIPRTCREDGGEFPEDMQKYAYGLSVMKGVKYPVVMAIVEVESGYKADAMRETGEVGYMQLIELWHGDSMKKLGCRDLVEPTGNLLVGINFLKRMLVEHGGDYGMALTAYRYGSDGAKRNFFSKGETTCEYAQKVLDVAARIEGELERTRQIQADGKNAGMTPEERGGKENGRNPESGRDGKVPNGKLRHAPTASTPRL